MLRFVIVFFLFACTIAQVEASSSCTSPTIALKINNKLLSDTVCVGQSVTLDANQTAGTCSNWQFGWQSKSSGLYWDNSNCQTSCSAPNNGAFSDFSNTSVQYHNGYSSIVFNASSVGTYVIVLYVKCQGDTCTKKDSINLVVNPLPSPSISAGGPTTFCSGGSVTLDAGSFSSYVWSNSATAQTITPTTGGNYKVTVTDANGCSASSSTTTVTVNPLPTASISPSSPSTCSGVAINLTASGAGTGGSYAWSDGAITSVDAVSPSTATTYSVTVTNSNNCSASTSKLVNVNQLPTITGVAQNAPVCDGNTATFTVTGLPVTGTYTITYSIGTSTGLTATSLSNSVNTFTHSLNTADSGTVLTITQITNNSTNCSASVSASTTVNVAPATGSAGTIVGPSVSCRNATGIVFSVPAITNATSYVWSLPNGATITNGSTTDSITVSFSGSANSGNIHVTGSGTCGSGNQSPNFSLTIGNPVTPSVTITSSSSGQICSGNNVTFTAAISNGGSSPSYQWKRNGLNVGTNSSTFSTNSLANNDSVYCILTSNDPCRSVATATSNVLKLSVTNSVTPNVTLNVNPSVNICQGTPVTFTAQIQNQGFAPTYQWRKNGSVIVGNNTAQYIDSTLQNNDNITFVLTNTDLCVTTSTAQDNKTMTVGNRISGTVIGGNVAVCLNGTVSFNTSISGGSNNLNYKWGTSTSVNGPFTTVQSSNNYGGYYPPTTVAGTTYYQLQVNDNSSLGCGTFIPPVDSVVVIQQPSVQGSTNQVCSGGQYSLKILGNPPSLPIIYVNFFNEYSGYSGSYNYVSNSNPYVSTGLPSVYYSNSNTIIPDSFSYFVNVQFDYSTNCPSLSYVPIPLSISNQPSVSISLVTPITICTGGVVKVQANGLANSNINSLKYTWQISPNGSSGWSNVGQDTSLLVLSGVTTAGFVRCIYADSTKGCISVSNAVSFSVVPQPTVTLTTLSTSTICQGGSAQFSAIGNGGVGANFSYNWFAGNDTAHFQPIVGTGNTLAYTINSTNVFKVVYQDTLTSCAVTSIIDTIKTVAQPSISINASRLNLCAGGTDTLAATASGGTGSLSYFWQSSPTGANTWNTVSGVFGSTYIPSGISQSTDYRCIYATSNGAQPTGCSATSSLVTVSITGQPIVAVSSVPGVGVDNVCNPGPVHLAATAQGGLGLLSYQWQSSADAQTWFNVGGNSANFDTTNIVASTYYRCVYASSGTGCSSASVAKLITVVPQPTTSISTVDTVCTNGTVQLLCRASGGVGNFNFKWQNFTGGVWVDVTGATNSTYTTPPLSNSTQYRCFYYDSLSNCLSTSNTDSIDVRQQPTVSISGGNITVCTGASIPLTALPIGGPGQPTIQWQSSLNGSTGWSPATGNNTSLIYYPVTTSADTLYYQAVATYTASGCSSAVSNNNYVQVVNQPIASITGGNLRVCTNANINLQSAYTNGTGTVSYQWQKSTDNQTFVDTVGLTNATFSPNTQALGTKYYRVNLSFSGLGCNNVYSNTDSLLVSGPLRVHIDTFPGPACLNIPISPLIANSSGGRDTIFQWYAGTSINGLYHTVGANQSTLPLDSSTIGSFYYYCAFSSPDSGCGVVRSDTGQVIIHGLPDPPVPSPSNTQSGYSITNIKCFGRSTGTIQFYNYPPYDSVSIDNGLGFQSVLNAFNFLPSGRYGLVVKDGITGCRTIVTYDNVLNLATSALTVSVNTPKLNCYGDKTNNLSITSFGGSPTFLGGQAVYYTYWYQIKNGIDSLISSGVNAPTVGAGTYLVRDSDKYGCSVVDTIILNQPDPLVVIIPYDTIRCFGVSTASLQPIIRGGTAPFFRSFNWSPGGIQTQNATGLSAGIYTLVVTDTAGCRASQSATVALLDSFTLGITGRGYDCSTNYYGLYTLRTNGRSPFTYFVSDSIGDTIIRAVSNSKTIVLDTLRANLYTITVVDSQGCFENKTLDLVAPPGINPPQLSQTHPDVDYLGTGAAMVVNDTFAHYRWSNDTTNNTPIDKNLNTGVYTITVTNAAGCSSVGSIRITLTLGADNGLIDKGNFMFPNKPNPFTTATIIPYHLEEQTKVSIRVFDAVGKEVTVLTDEMKDPGSYAVEFETGSLPNGIYYCWFKAGKTIMVNKMIILK